MGFLEMIVAIVLITSAAEVLKAHSKRRQAPPKELVAEIKALREEIRQLRQENHDVMLGLDAGVEQVNRRVSRLESQARLGSGSSAAEEAEAAPTAARFR